MTATMNQSAEGANMDTYVSMGWNFVSESVSSNCLSSEQPSSVDAPAEDEQPEHTTDVTPPTTADVVFSNDGSDAIARSVSASAVPRQAIDADKLEIVYEISRCVREVTLQQAAMVALQFPDEMLPDATRVSEELTRRTPPVNGTSVKYCILGDTSYGSCCVDEVAAEHIAADMIIHYGKSCLSPTVRLPVLYVFGHSEIDTTKCVDWLMNLLEANTIGDPVRESDKNNATDRSNEGDNVQNTTIRRAIVFYDVRYAHAVNAVKESVLLRWSNQKDASDSAHLQARIVWSELVVPDCTGTRTPTATDATSSIAVSASISTHPDTKSDSVASAVDHSTHVRFGRSFDLPTTETASEGDLTQHVMVYIGPETQTLTNLMMYYSSNSFATFDPESSSGKVEVPNANKALMKRYYMMQRARDANVVGILAGTLGVKDSVATMQQLKALCKRSGKKTYTFVMGKLNVPKLANFMEIDVYVLVACPENSMVLHVPAKHVPSACVSLKDSECLCVALGEAVAPYRFCCM
eukprot:m.762040 g.762040  ORF g.762040 m.762040 type:complete len:522 (+) comp23208_c1_seq14:182-1747(+)